MKKMFHHDHASTDGNIIEEIILGGQDGVVNVLGVVLGIATATTDAKIVLIAGIAVTFAESISMAAVAYTSQKAAKQYFESQLLREKKEIEETPEIEKQEIREIFEKKGFKGKDLDKVVEIITSNKEVWLNVMMSDELNLGSYKEKDPKRAAIIVGLAAFFGSLFPITPFFFTDAQTGIIYSFILSIGILFLAGAVKAKYTIGNWLKNGLEMAAIGTIAAIAGYIIGLLLQGI
ncbi:MAG: VIT1/CCC1 transporter family protein [Candidatus Moranbacteria bacterium]|nr:VIT1/CCC1 transporter family protein [Candidatus Moranbacteria bacterium]